VTGGGCGRTQQHDGGELDQHGEDDFDPMEVRAGGHVVIEIAVVDPVQAPEYRYRVDYDVPQPCHEAHRHHGDDDGEREGLSIVIEQSPTLHLGKERHADWRGGKQNAADVDRLVDDYLTVKDSLEPIPAGELLKRAREGLVTVLDVRPSDEYTSGHLPGAINIPLGELEGHLDELDSDSEIIAYCSGPTAYWHLTL
jgi:hypothetical protein